MKLRDKETGETFTVIEIKDGWVFYNNGEVRLDHLYEFYEEVICDEPTRMG